MKASAATTSPKTAPILVKGKLALMDIDEQLKVEQGVNGFKVVRSMTMCTEMVKNIEQVGSAYEKIKK
jgi:hypothetical protein